MRNSLRNWTIVACLLALGLTGSAWAADEKPLDRADLNQRIYKALRDVVRQGAELYNTGNPGACYRLYAGSLLTLEPLLDQRPDLQKAIEHGLADARRQSAETARAWALRYVIDDLWLAVTPPEAPGPPGGAQPSKEDPGKDIGVPAPSLLWDHIGEDRLKKVIDDFVERVMNDPQVNVSRDGKYPATPEKIAKFKTDLLHLASQVSGGPYKYTGPDMLTIHKGMGITGAQFDAFAGHLQKALEANGVRPADQKTFLERVGSKRQDIVEKETPPQSIWNRIGEERLKKVIDDLVPALLADPKVNFDRGGKYKFTPEKIAKLKTDLRHMASQVSGGPYKYKGDDMLTVHKGMGITGEEFDAFLAHLQKALEANGVARADQAIFLFAVNSKRNDIVEK
jgi:hemoglobin